MSPTPPPSPAPGLSVQVREEDGAVVLRPSGELDHDTAEPLQDALATALAGPRGLIVVDCSGLDFCDSTGLNLLLRTRLDAEARGRHLAVASPGSMVSLMLELTGTAGVLRVHATVAEALAEEPPDATAPPDVTAPPGG
ncbi:STAS domain-containing protein [Kitasatospora sp. NPDC051853]|uniref:STAS domain-containing protein n=1 Tax=Kitasatospora sp. NPDC051853 TaxID=3364058 RepID=UPI00379AB2B5